MKPLKILILFDKVVPVANYGGIQRVVWWLGKELAKEGHRVVFLVGKGSYSPFAKVIFFDPEKSISEQIPDDVDIVHSYIPIDEDLKKPYLVHMESNTQQSEYNINTVFVSRSHAERHHAECFVYNGLDPEDYGKPDFTKKKDYLHFLGKAAWGVKNIKGTIDIAKRSHKHLHVLGGSRINFHMGFRLTLDPRIHFHGMIGGEKKNKIINDSVGLVFPVVWHEPFGIAITESMYFGCPVFGTPYGSLPEIVDQNSGFLSAKSSELIKMIEEAKSFNPKQIHERVIDIFSVKQMTAAFLKLYEKVLNGETLNKSKPFFEKNSEQKFLPFQ